MTGRGMLVPTRCGVLFGWISIVLVIVHLMSSQRGRGREIRKNISQLGSTRRREQASHTAICSSRGSVMSGRVSTSTEASSASGAPPFPATTTVTFASVTSALKGL